MLRKATPLRRFMISDKMGDIMTLAEKIQLLEKECFSDPWSITSVEAQLSGENGICILHEEDGRAVGYVLGTSVCGEAELYRIAVIKEYRRRKIGEGLMKSFFEECNKRNCEKAFLEVRSRNSSAISLYEKSGFEKISVRKNYYGDDDAVIFVKNF